MCENDSEFNYPEDESDLRPLISREAWRELESAIRRSPCSEEDALQKLYDACH